MKNDQERMLFLATEGARLRHDLARQFADQVKAAVGATPAFSEHDGPFSQCGHPDCELVRDR